MTVYSPKGHIPFRLQYLGLAAPFLESLGSEGSGVKMGMGIAVATILAMSFHEKLQSDRNNGNLNPKP